MRAAMLALLATTLTACVFEVEPEKAPRPDGPIEGDEPDGDEPVLVELELRGRGVIDTERGAPLEPTEDDASVIIDATVPTSMACDETAQVSITVENLGRNTWTEDSHKLGAVDDSDPMFGPDPRVYLGGITVPTGGRHTFTFTLRAPAAAGTVHTDWQMVHEGVQWFGEEVGFDVAVVCDSPPPPPPPPPPALELPDMSDVVDQVAAERPDLLHASCIDEPGGNNDFLHLVVDRLRAIDTRWGYNWKRGNEGDLSQDVVDYHWGSGDPEGSTDVFIVDIIGGHCGPDPRPAWIDVTEATFHNGTIGRWTSLGRF